jgi:hypothetical protein
MKGNLFLFIHERGVFNHHLFALSFFLFILNFNILLKRKTQETQSIRINFQNRIAETKNKQTSHFLYNLANVLLFVEQDEETYLVKALFKQCFMRMDFLLFFDFKCWTIFSDVTSGSSNNS